MPDYSQGKIYQLVDKSTGEMFYIGSTTQSLIKRLKDHKSQCRNKPTAVHRYINENNIEFDIKLIEEYACDSKDKLEWREGEYIRRYKDTHKLLNSMCPGDVEIREMKYLEHNTGKYDIKSIDARYREDKAQHKDELVDYLVKVSGDEFDFKFDKDTLNRLLWRYKYFPERGKRNMEMEKRKLEEGRYTLWLFERYYI